MSEIDAELYVKLVDLVYESSGLYFDERKKYFVSRRVEQRVQATGADNFDDYYRLLRYGDSSSELRELTESLTTNETYFFREYPQLQSFADDILPEVLEEKRKRGDRYLRIWSAGCASGDEPYTLAIILREVIEDFDRWEITITATDISREMLRSARLAVYGERAVKEVPTVYRERYFRPQEDGYKLLLPVTRMVRFRQANLLDENVARETDGQDFLFCRNVLIYFDDTSRRRVLDLFFDALRPGGYIFLGHSESVGRITSAFRLVRRGSSLAYMK
jgi:chemotaxis protein methyltransferase CheR